MSDENENVMHQEHQGGGDTYHEYDNSVHHAVSLWPLAVIAFLMATVALTWTFLPDAKQREKIVPNGKAYVALGNILDCQPIIGGNGPYRSFVRTPKDEFFAIYWRSGFQPPVFGAAIGQLKYHQCGTQEGVAVHCFDSFAVTSERVKILDLSPSSMVPVK